MVKKVHLTALLDIMTMMTSDQLFIMLPQITWYVQYFNDNKKMSFKVSDVKKVYQNMGKNQQFDE